MKRLLLWALALTIMVTFSVTAETINDYTAITVQSVENMVFPDLADEATDNAVQESNLRGEARMQQAIWPFGKKDEDSRAKPKSTRKAFFLSLLIPGLGETYVGSKRGIAFIGIEAVAWWMYLTNTNKGYDIEDDFRAFADEHWYYTNTKKDSNDIPPGHSYYDWLVGKKYIKDPDNVGPYDYDKIKEEIEQNADISIHHYSGEGSQQDYEMIGKYPQFVYGWEDIVEKNSTLDDGNGKFNNNFDENISIIQSDLRDEYEDMRYDSNKKLKAGQRGIHIMIINRILSAIDAGRLAYNHNKKLESELSSVRIRVVQKQILDNKVTMLTISRKF